VGRNGAPNRLAPDLNRSLFSRLFFTPDKAPTRYLVDVDLDTLAEQVRSQARACGETQVQDLNTAERLRSRPILWSKSCPPCDALLIGQEKGVDKDGPPRLHPFPCS
jgi:hypothetical protein